MATREQKAYRFFLILTNILLIALFVWIWVDARAAAFIWISIAVLRLTSPRGDTSNEGAKIFTVIAAIAVIGPYTVFAPLVVWINRLLMGKIVVSALLGFPYRWRNCGEPEETPPDE